MVFFGNGLLDRLLELLDPVLILLGLLIGGPLDGSLDGETSVLTS